MRGRKAAGPKAAMLHRGDLRGRGWTGGMMRRFLPAPEATRPNILGRAPVPLWSPSTIEAIEGRPEFREALARSRRRREAARKAVETKRASMDAWIAGLEIELPDVDAEELTRLAIRSYNDRALERAERRGDWDSWDHFRPATAESDPQFLARITVNFIRHAGTDYVAYLAETYGRVGGERAYPRIKARVLDAIAAKYPGLAGECERQKERSS